MCKSCVSIGYRSTASFSGSMSEVVSRTLGTGEEERCTGPPHHMQPKVKEEKRAPEGSTSTSSSSSSSPPCAAATGKGRELRLCSVCGDVTERRHLNYGGEACFSCRAFFRRIHQKSSPPSLECKQGGGCVVTPGNRRRCQKCRYERCLMAGMRPECVMDEQQRRNRSTKLQAAATTEAHPSGRGGGGGAGGNRSKGRRKSQAAAASGKEATAPPPSLQLRPTYQLQEQPSSFTRMFLQSSASVSPTHGSSSPPTSSSSPSPPISPTQQHQQLSPQAVSLVHHLRQEQFDQQRRQMQEQYEQLRVQQQQQQQRQEQQRQFYLEQQQLRQHQQDLSLRQQYRPHQYLLPYRRPQSPPHTPVRNFLYKEEEAAAAPAAPEPSRYQTQTQPLSLILTPTPSPPSQLQFQSPSPRPSIPPSRCTIIRSLLQQDDATEPIPSGLLFSPFSASKQQIENKKDEEEEEKPKRPFSKKRMILDRLEREAKKVKKEEEATEVVAAFLERRGSASSTASSSFSGGGRSFACSDEEGGGSLAETQEKLDYMKESWAMAVHQMGVTPEFRAALVLLHRAGGGEEENGEAKARMREYVFAITRVFRKFALQQPDFRSLSDEDQSGLVLRNAPIFVQYIFARYATARDPADKNDWLLLEDDEEETVKTADEEEVETFTALAARTGIFPSARPDNMFRYEAILRSLDEPRLKKVHNYLVARACLFHLGQPGGDPVSGTIRDEGGIRAAQERNLSLMDRVAGLPGRDELRCLLLRLDDAVEFFSLHAEFFSGGGQHAADVLHSAHALALPPTDADRAWLAGRAALVRWVAEEVPFDSRRAREAARFHYLGEPLSPRGAVDAMAVSLERCRRLLRAHPEFLALPEQDKETLERGNAFKAAALMHARLEGTSEAAAASPEGLWGWTLGSEGAKAWAVANVEAGVAADAAPVCSSYSLRKEATSAQEGTPLTEEELFRFEELCRRVAPALRDDRIFPVVLLLVLFSGSHRLAAPESRRVVAALQRRFVVTLKRTLCCCDGGGADEKEGSSGSGHHYASFLDQHLLEVNMCLRDITEIVVRYHQRIHAGLCSSC